MEIGATARRPPGPLDSLLPIASTLAEIIGIRVSLLALELTTEVHRRKRQLQLAAVAAALLYTAFALLTLLLLNLFWDSYRNEALVLLGTLYLAGAGLAWWRLRAIGASLPAPFADSLRELRRDLADWTRSP